MLHILRHPPQTDHRFATCLRVLASQQGLLLIEEAIYALLPNSPSVGRLGLLPASVQLYVLESDMLARGLALDDLPARVKVVDYNGMVRLCSEYPKVVSW
ncbi:sulfurtransferase complex subunit TusB [Halopseudomonas pelagia]|uniref:sulfurtransferase complex subunit TusB n=1 Tax=Halopseudomonas pelagia TaxID=553151 RepID=UPI00039B1FE3|nr:sulfurtransferase complex subunit TusB [Halopseudomonas pelagia]|tara:strand:+ start:72 stop:371 length:300 start_codon:yes stop_codon:yes gene_type:complete